MLILLRRILTAVPTLLLLPLVVFLLLDLPPGDATATVLDVTASDEARQQVRAELGLDDSFLERYLRYAGGLLRGDLGRSVRSGTPVAEEISRRLPYRLVLVAASVTLGTLIGYVSLKPA